MFLKRTLTALVVIPLVIFILIYAPPPLFFVLISGAIFLGLKELLFLTQEGGAERIVGVGGGLLLALAIYLKGDFAILTLPLFLLFLILSYLFFFGERRVRFQIPLWGALYIGLFLSYLPLIRMKEEGKFWLLLFFLTIWIGDTASYLVGKAFGRHKLCPKISPQKTIEGSVAGLVGSVLVIIFLKGYFSLSWEKTLILGVFLNVLAQLGDLYESMIKRRSGVKDSGRLFPGHGGMLDRIDSLLFSAPFLYYYLVFLKR